MSEFAVERCKHGCTDECLACYDETIESLRQRVKELEDSLEASYAAGVVNGELAALKQQGEPVAWMSPHTRNLIEPHRAYSDWIPLYTAPTIPEGYVMVPVEPTPEMLTEAGTMTNYDAEAGGASPDADHIEWYKTMLAAAPKPEE